jgi:hypothetical protein
MNELEVISLHAGKRPDGQDVVEQIRVALTESKTYRLVQSPAFIQGLASGDEISFDSRDNSFELISHSGNLAIRIFCKSDIDQLKDALLGAMEKLGAELDFSNERMMVFSIHVSCGFQEIEKLLNQYVGDKTQSAWFYGNVYDPKDGTTPLNWWQNLDDPEK